MWLQKPKFPLIFIWMLCTCGQFYRFRIEKYNWIPPKLAIVKRNYQLFEHWGIAINIDEWNVLKLIFIEYHCFTVCAHALIHDLIKVCGAHRAWNVLSYAIHCIAIIEIRIQLCRRFVSVHKKKLVFRYRMCHTPISNCLKAYNIDARTNKSCHRMNVIGAAAAAVDGVVVAFGFYGFGNCVMRKVLGFDSE